MTRKRKDKKSKDEKARPWLVGRLNTRGRSRRLEIKRSKIDKTPSGKRSMRATIIWVVLLVALLSWVPVVKVNCNLQDETGECSNLELYNKSLARNLPFLKRFAPFINERNLEDTLMSSGKVDSVKVRKTWYNFLDVNIVERTAYAVWWSDSNENDQYLIDKNGVVMGRANNAESNLASLSHIIDDVELQPIVGEPLVESQVVQLSYRYIDEAMLPGYSLQSVRINESPREFLAKLRATDGSKKSFEVLFTTTRSFDKQILDVELVLDFLKEEGTSFKYIDVRLESSTPYR